ncbi:putative bifunctional diguanylate cyclase/phosphodiesterase [Paractinoplanes globisporus]|uniref:Bifunctional diguanylate cyclase/phosphodiesterase n=1 Tax=Paractinoplanes globisporus TaxID=113565 RepID=A0ABW6WBN4_9ACTN|nr:EAL domain-containing protein [Actinoplanes globisporus]
MTVRRPLPVVILVVLALAGLLAATVPPGLTAAVTTVAALCAAAACLVRAGRRRGRMRIVWGALGLGVAAGGVLGDRTPGYLAMVPLVAAAIFLVPLPPRTGIERVRAVIDTLLIASALIGLGYHLLFDPALKNGSFSVAYAVGNVVLGTVALAGLSRMRRGVPDLRAITLTAGALLGLALSSSVAYAGLETAASAGWLAGFVLLGFAATLGHTGADVDAEAEPDGRPSVTVLLPYAIVVVGLIVGFVRLALGGTPSMVGSWARSISIGLIVARQVLIMVENRRLARRLEDRVIERTADLRAREQRFRALVEQSTDSMAILEADSTVRYQSESVERIFGYPASALVGRPFCELAGRKVGGRIQAAIDEVKDVPGATTVFEIMLWHADGQARLAEMTITNLLDDPHVQGLVFNTRDISEAQELQESLRREAYYDALTGLASRAGFRERLAEALDRDPARVAILQLDLDGFKEINDSLGHDAGDHLLLHVAERLRRLLPAPHVVARLGGDEFAVIVEADEAADDAELTAMEIIAALTEPIDVDDRELYVSASIGIAPASGNGDLDQLMRDADLAMYRAKDAGGGGYAAYDPSMHDAVVRRLELASDLRLALERDELVLHYQPKVDLRTGEIIGFEALVRWQHPVRGMVPPLDFIGVAEATGLIVPLGRWVLTQACRQAVAWDRPLKMAVNLSVRQFEAGDVAEMVASVLAETGMPPGRLVLEMTESVLLTDTDDNLARIVSLKALGVQLAMDDFGTGYSSLAYLRRFPMDVLKIDRSFVDRLGGESEDEALVRTIVRLGQRFGMHTVAEGIENETQLAILQEMGCDYAQGYLLSRPLPEPDATALLDRGLPFPVPAPA